MVAIASGGCNVTSYLTAEPEPVLAVDLNRAHLALLELKLAAAGTCRATSVPRLFAEPNRPRTAALPTVLAAHL